MAGVEKWLKLIAIIHIIGGLLLPFVVFTPIATPYFEHLQKAFPQGDLTSMKFLIGVFGPTVASWGLLFYYALGKAFLSKTQKDWWFLFSTVMIWLVFDTVFSLLFNVTAHLYINILVALLTLFPLLALKPHFNRKENTDAS